jgi:hypothetical protein
MTTGHSCVIAGCVAADIALGERENSLVQKGLAGADAERNAKRANALDIALKLCA